MSFNPAFHQRRSIRLRGYNYTAPGSYFVTIVTHRRICLFGEIADGLMRLNEWGIIARDEWLKTAAIRSEITLDEFAIMPNHIHAIVTIMECGNEPVGATRRVAPTLVAQSIGAIMAQYKSVVSKRINRIRGTPGIPIWQRNYGACPERLPPACPRGVSRLLFLEPGWLRSDGSDEHRRSSDAKNSRVGEARGTHNS
jgi:putative transposase